jgi:cell division protein FtsI/penicillin-binding protein 2
MNQQLQRLTWAVAVAFVAVALAAGYWGYARRDELLARADNPRRVLAELRVPRGAIYDRHDQVLAETVGETGALTRHYPYPPLAAVLGYVSPFYGSAGIEAAYDGVLHGDAGLDPVDVYWQSAVLGTPPAGRGIRLTLDLTLQQQADNALGQQAGAVVLLDAQTGEVLAVASHPTFDANQLDDQWQGLVADPAAPLLNRATLALYQPGGALWPFVLAGAAEAGLLDLGQTYGPSEQSLPVAETVLPCRRLPRVEAITVRESLLFSCPGPTGALGASLGADGLQRVFAAFHLTTPPELGIPTTAATEAGVVAPGTETAAAVGQQALTVTPLHLALATAALARGGLLPAPQLVLATQAPDGTWQPTEKVRPPEQVISAEAADLVRDLLAHGYAATALTGTKGQALAWYLAFGPQTDARFVVVVLLEGGQVADAAGLGQRLLASALAKP